MICAFPDIAPISTVLEFVNVQHWNPIVIIYPCFINHKQNIMHKCCTNYSNYSDPKKCTCTFYPCTFVSKCVIFRNNYLLSYF